MTENNEIEEKLKINQQQLFDAENNIKMVQSNEQKWKNKYAEKEEEFQQYKEQKEKDINPQKLAEESEKKIESLQLKYSELQSQNDEIGRKCEQFKNETVELKINLNDQREK